MPADEEEELLVVGATTEPEPDDDDDAPEPAVVADGNEPKSTRRQRRQERGRELVEAANRRAEAAERQAQATTQALQQLASRPVIAQVQQPAQQGPDPYEVEAYQLRQYQVGLQERFNAAAQRGDQQMVAQLQQEAFELKERQDANTYVRNVRRYGLPQQAQQPQMTPDQVQAISDRGYAQRRMNEEHPDIVSDAQATRVFLSRYNERLAMGEPDDWSTLNKAADEARARLRKPPRGGLPVPDAGRRARLSGTSTGAAATGQRKMVKMTVDRQRMADIAFSHIKDPAKRYQHWANTAGKGETD